MKESTDRLRPDGGEEDDIEWVTRAIRRPTHPDGEEYRFTCCLESKVYVTGDERRICRTCGHDWTSELLDDEDTDD